MKTKILGAIFGYMVGAALVYYFSSCNRDNFLIACTTILGVEIFKQLERQYIKRGSDEEKKAN